MSRLLDKLTRTGLGLRVKECKRNINHDRSSNIYRVRYGDRSAFDVLRISIFTDEEQTVYEIHSAHLPEKDSIHFKAQRNEIGKYSITWSPLAIDKTIKRISDQL